MVNNLPTNTGDTGDETWIPGLGRSHGKGNGNPSQYFCLKNPMDRGAWRATVHGVTRVRCNLSTEHAESGYHCEGKKKCTFTRWLKLLS